MTSEELFMTIYAQTDEKTRAFMRAIAPYWFTADGQKRPPPPQPPSPFPVNRLIREGD